MLQMRNSAGRDPPVAAEEIFAAIGPKSEV